MDHAQFEELAVEVLDTFEEIAEGAAKKLKADLQSSADGLVVGNTFTGAQAYQNLTQISQNNREGYETLAHEPAIARLLLEDEDGKRQVLYIARRTNLSLPSGKQLAMYGSPLGRLAELPIGDEASIQIGSRPQHFSLIEKTSFTPILIAGAWDSTGSQYRHVDHGVFSIESLRALLGATESEDANELDRLLEQASLQSVIRAGISHQVRTAMGLRDQPILDRFQGEIFRLPLDSQLIILGPPGTGKTTTLIKRLSQKLDTENLDEREKRFSSKAENGLLHENSWLMFTPSELLKHYLKEAFSKEGVAASDSLIKTWISYRNDIARNTLGILRTANGGKFIQRPEMANLAEAVLADPRQWYGAYSDFHAQRLKTQLKDGVMIVQEAITAADAALVGQLQVLVADLEKRSLLDVYRELDKQESKLKAALDGSIEYTDNLLKQERNRLYNRDKEVFQRLAKFIAELQQDEDPDEEAEFDEDEPQVIVSTQVVDIQIAVQAYLGAIRTLARSKYRRRSLHKHSRAGKVVQWLADKVPTDAVLLEIGQRISFQNGLRRFVNAAKRYVSEAPASYPLFRKAQANDPAFYREVPASPLHLAGTELDAIILLMLRNARTLMTQSYIERQLDMPRYEYLRNLAGLFRNQIMVDEATDFSVLQLGCMESMTSLKSRSFFACGDFNQRITSTGIRNMDQITWVSPRLSARAVNLVYRQSRALNDFACELLRLLGGDLSAQGRLPDESTHDGVKPVLIEGATQERAAEWIAQRIIDIERIVGEGVLPTIAVLVNDETEVKPMAERLSICLEQTSLKAVACENGKALGEGTDVRVFDIQHIKGLEFEAVFFDGIDRLAVERPALFGRYLYVGATRAASYLGMVSYGPLPEKLGALRAHTSELGSW